MSDHATPLVLQSAIDAFNKWSDHHMLSEQEQNAVDETLYHYTDGPGLKGILESETIWFTDYRHMNDPSELLHGIDMAKDVARIAANGADGRVRLFFDFLQDCPDGIRDFDPEPRTRQRKWLTGVISYNAVFLLNAAQMLCNGRNARLNSDERR